MSISNFVILVHVILGPLSALHALLYKRDSRAAMSWIGLCLILPILGAFLYFLFGINRVQKRAHKLLVKSKNRQTHFSLKKSLQHMHASDFLNLPQQVIDFERSVISQELSEKIKRLTATSDALCSHELVANNAISILYNGDQAYPAMLAAIESAQSQVYLMTYIFRPDTIGKKFIKALAEAQKRGVEVKIILDGIADYYYFPRTSRRMRKMGLDVITFLALSWYPPSIGINLRNHKKLLLVDNKYAFSGGMNITNINCLHESENKDPTQDIHFQIQGPVIEQCYALFAEVWTFVTKTELDLAPHIYTRAGLSVCRAFVDGPDENLAKIELILISAISVAKKSIRIMTPYFLPSREMISALNTAALRGVMVEVIIPEYSDNRIADWASRNLHWELLQGSVKIFMQAGPFNHSKIVTIDKQYALLGSANIDARSLRLNYELMFEVIDKNLVSELSNHCKNIIERSREITLQEADARSIPQRIRDSLSWLFMPYL